MDDTVTMQALKQQELLEGQQGEVTHAADTYHGQVQQTSSEIREMITAVAREIDRQGDNVVEDMRGAFGTELSDEARQVLDTTYEVMNKAQEGATAFFRVLEEEIKSAAREDHQRLADVSNDAARTFDRFAADMQRQNELLTQMLCEALDNGDPNDARKALQHAAETTDALKDDFYKEIGRLHQQVDGEMQRAVEQLVERAFANDAVYRVGKLKDYVLPTFELKPRAREAAEILFGQRWENDNEWIRQVWDNGVNRHAKETMERVAHLYNSGQVNGNDSLKTQAYDMATKVYESCRERFWQAVGKRPDLIERFEQAGLTVEPGKTPYYRRSDGREERVTIEHFDARRSDDPTKAVDSSNLVFSLARENSVVLEAIRRAERQMAARRH